ncbi:MAG TPA: nucleoside-triphosphatase [Elusimicrobiota bacterium]|nr:nucleoside-triphosphatase [Elusimicrobiota bacterium]
MPNLKIFFALALLGTAFSKSWAWLIPAALLATAGNWGRAKELRRLKFWIFFFLASFLPFFLIRRQEMLLVSGRMFLRAVLLYNAVLLYVENVDAERMKPVLRRAFGERLSLTLSVAVNILPVMRRIFLQTHGVFLLRAPSSRARLFGYVRFLRAVLSQSLLAAERLAENMIVAEGARQNEVHIISGPHGSGKTTLAAALAEKFQERGWPVAGVLSPGAFEAGRRVRIEARDAASGETRLLASRNGEVSDPIHEHGGFRFSKSGFEFAKESLLRRAAGSIVFVDEIGPLELAGEGYAETLENLLHADAAALYLVVREGLVQDVTKKFKISQYTILRPPAWEDRAAKGTDHANG